MVSKRRQGIKERQRQAKRCEVIRLMLHMSKNDHTEGPAQNLKGENIGSQALSSLTQPLLHLTLSQSFTSFALLHAEGKHRYFCHLPQACQWKVPWYRDLRIKVNRAAMCVRKKKRKKKTCGWLANMETKVNAGITG